MTHPYLENLRLIAEYVFFDDAPSLLGVSKRLLTAWVKGTRKPGPEDTKNISRIAAKMRRRQSQVERYQREEDERAARRSARANLRLIGKESISIPDKLPPFLRSYEIGKLASPVFIYDFRDITRAADVAAFFRFMKTMVPNGSFFFTYRLTTPGITTEERGMHFTDKSVRELMRAHNTRSPRAAIMAEIGTAAADSVIQHRKDGFHVVGVRYVSTRYMSFCDPDSISGTCEVQTDDYFVHQWLFYNDKSARREVVEVGISYPRPLTRTEEEIEEDRQRGADPVTGLVYVWQD